MYNRWGHLLSVVKGVIDAGNQLVYDENHGNLLLKRYPFRGFRKGTGTLLGALSWKGADGSIGDRKGEMSMAKEKEYRIGKRFDVFRNIFLIAGTAVVIVFYVIYDFLLKDVLPAMVGLPLLAVFLLLELVMIAAARWWCSRVKSMTSYTLTPQALEIQRGTNHQTLAWKDFSRAYYGQPDFTGGCPVSYEVSGQRFIPSPYLDSVWRMNREILEYIRPYAEIEEGLEKKIEAFM